MNLSYEPKFRWHFDYQIKNIFKKILMKQNACSEIS